jgi:hypothetical protein
VEGLLNLQGKALRHEERIRVGRMYNVETVLSIVQRLFDICDNRHERGIKSNQLLVSPSFLEASLLGSVLVRVVRR